jgi:hypothetical protein
MQPIFETVINQIIKSIESEDGIIPQTESKKKTGDFSLDSDSDEGEQLVGFDIDTHFIDEKAAAIHALGNIALNCSGLLFPYLEKVVNALMESGFYMHENIRYHVCLTMTQLSFGLLRLFTDQKDSDEKFSWRAGLPAPDQLPTQVVEYLTSVLFPHFMKLF